MLRLAAQNSSPLIPYLLFRDAPLLDRK
jgi:hypothetical protein